MLSSKPILLNVSYKHHVYVALFISIWLVFFLIVIAPFDVSDLPFKIRLQILPPYGLISFVSYMMIIPIQNFIYKKTNSWDTFYELAFYVVFHIFTLFGTYFYYKTDIINGTYPFSEFVLQIFYPIFIVLFILIFIARWYINNKILENNTTKLTITGDNKQDILLVNKSDLVCVSSADNYVEVNYIKEGQLHKKLLRSTLKKIEDQVPYLTKVHRSYLINPDHFIEWKNNKTIILTHREVPISSNYKDVILELKNSSLNP